MVEKIEMPVEFEAWLAAIREERARFDAVLAGVSPERMSQAGAVGEWSVKDVLAHLSVWQSRAITLLFQIERGGRPQSIEGATAQARRKLNDRDYAEQKDRPLDRVQMDFRGAHQQMLKRLEAFRAAPAGLFDPRRHAALAGKSLAQYVWENSAGHEAEHRVQIEAWLHAGA